MTKRKTIKQRTKSMIAQHYTRRFCTLISHSVDLMASGQYEKAYENDQKIIELLNTMRNHSHIMKAADNSVDVLLPLYIKRIQKVTFYLRDDCYDLPSAELFVKELVDDGAAEAVMSEDGFHEYVLNVIHLTVWMQKMDSYRSIYDQYIRNMDDVPKADIVLQLLKYYIGDIELKEVSELIGRLEGQLAILDEKIDAAKSKKKRYALQKRRTQYVADIVDIADRTFLPIDEELFDTIIRKELKTHVGKKSSPIVHLVRRCLREDLYIEEIKEWFDTIPDKTTPHSILVQTSLTEAETGKLQDGTFSEPVSVSDENNVSENIRILMHDNTLPRSEILNILKEYEKTQYDKLKRERDLEEKIDMLGELYIIKHRIRVQAFWADFDTAMQKIPEPAESDTVFMLHTDQSPMNGACAFPLMLAAKKRGYYCIPSGPNLFRTTTNDPELNQIALSRYFNSYAGKKDTGRHLYEWDIDIDNKKIDVGGFNVFQPIYDVVSRWQFSCFYNFDTNAWSRARTYGFISVIEKGFWQCEQLNEYARKNNKTVRIIATSPHVPLYAAYAIYCESKGYKNNLNLICVRSGYDDYFRDSQEFSSTLTAINMTKHPEARTSLFGTKEGFEKYYQRNIGDIEQIRARAETWFKSQRSKKYDEDNDADQKKRAEIMDKIKSYKQQGKKVYLMVGKLIFDMGVKETKGCAHNDLSHWATHTVEYIKNRPDILLLIKPHPHETRKTITMTDESINVFRDVIKTDLSDNIIYLEGQLFRNIDLASYIDVGLTWNSTSTLELAAMGVTVIMGDVSGYSDYPIGFPRVNSIEEYERFLDHPEEFSGDPDLRDKAICFLSYMGSEDINMLNRYTTFATSNYHIFDSAIHLDAVDDYIQNGDERLERMVDEIL